MTVRERLEKHRANPTCASCHQIMDPIGFSLENFDLDGRWRTTDGTSPIDASGQLVDGTRLTGVNDLRAALLSRSDAFVTSLTEKLLTYALGRRLEYYDEPIGPPDHAPGARPRTIDSPRSCSASCAARPFR